MSEVSELLEHMEHASHGGHGDGHGGKGGPGKQIGVTMALLGVALAFCAAMVGAQRTELIRTMVEQSNKYGLYHTETMKFRVAEGNYEMLKAISPKADEIQKVEQTLRAKRAPSGKGDDEDTAEVKELIASATEDMADLLTPDPEEVTKFKRLAKKYELDMKEAKEDAEAYDLKIEAHGEGAEGYERAQLGAEIGIVVASVALLMASRGIWVISVVCGIFCAGMGGFTFVHTHQMLDTADLKIKDAAERTLKLEEDDDEKAEPADAKKEAAPAKAEGKDGAKPEPGKTEPARTEPARPEPGKAPAK